MTSIYCILFGIWIKKLANNHFSVITGLRLRNFNYANQCHFISFADVFADTSPAANELSSVSNIGTGVCKYNCKLMFYQYYSYF